MKILYVTTIGGTMVFFRQLVRELVEEGHTVDIAANTSISNVRSEYIDLGCKIYPISCTRNPFDTGTLTAIKQLKKIVSEGNYDIVHCHTPIAAMCTRLACRKARKQGTKVIYTAHGFHFYKGAPLKNWLLYYPVEKICAPMTDNLITINQEDYELARRKLKAGKVAYVPGVGIDVARFADAEVDRNAKREEIGVPKDALMLLSVGELNENKNHETVIRALGEINDSNIHYVIAGKGTKREYLENLAKELHVNLHLLGFRNDIPELDQTANVFIHPSYREGLNVSIMEALASGLPVICGNIRGNVDLVNENSGELFDPFSISECVEAIRNIQFSDWESMHAYNRVAAKKYDIAAINSHMKEIYGEAQ